MKRKKKNSHLAVCALALLLAGARADQAEDPVVVYERAAELAAAGQRDEALRELEKLPGLPGGLDPSVYRGFRLLHGDPRFEALVKKIHAANPPRIASETAFTIGEKDLFPEGLAYDPKSRAFFASSAKQKILRIDGNGHAADFISPGKYGLQWTLGLRVDTKRGQLWAVSDDPRAFSGQDTRDVALYVFDIATAGLVKRYSIPPAFGGALNDVVVDESTGEAFATNTSNGCIWRAAPDATVLDEFMPTETAQGANGIALSPDARYLFVAAGTGVVRIDRRTKVKLLLPKPARAITASLDGVYFYRDSLVGIQNGIHPGRVVRFHLNRTWDRVVRAEILETYNPLFDGVTTGAIVDDSFYFFANTQSRKMFIGGPTPLAELNDISVQRLRLHPR